MSRGVVCRDARTAQTLGVVFLVAGSYLLYDAYEARGRTKPFALKWLPGA